MGTAAIIVSLYGALVLVGGVMGYIRAKSIPSLISDLVVGTALILMGNGILQGLASDIFVAIGLTGLLAIIMGVRFAKNNKFMPAGVLTILSAAVLVTLLSMR